MPSANDDAASAYIKPLRRLGQTTGSLVCEMVKLYRDFGKMALVHENKARGVNFLLWTKLT